MKRTHSTSVSSGKSTHAFTLLETMIVMGLAGIVLAIVMTTYNYSGTSFSAMGNYSDLDRKSRNSLDLLGREIRNSSALVAVTNNSTKKSLTFNNATTGKQITILYDATARTLNFYKTGQAGQTLLTSCDQWDYSLFGKVPLLSSTNIAFNSATNGAGAVDINACKLVNMTWKCSRSIFGSKRNTESIQTAQIVLRNKVN